VVAQVAVSMVLLVAGGLLVRSLSAARAADLGFPIDRLAVSSLDLSMVRYPRERAELFWRQLDDRLRARPEIASVALASRYPLSVNFNTTQVFVDGQPNGADDRGYVIDANRVSPGYFRTLGVALLEGRDFSETDTEQAPPVAIVTKAFARRFWPDESAVGKRVRTRVATGPVVEIVGVVADHKVRTIGESPRPVIHLARAQQFAPYAAILVQGRGDAAAASAALQQELLALEPGLLMMDHQPMKEALGSILFPSRVGAILLGAFGLLALALAAIGLYGVIAYSVSRRTREIGVRMALGASAPRVLRQVLGQGFALVGAGVAAGGLLALIATRILANALYGVGAADPVTYLLAAGLLAAVAAAANLVPAIRAARVDPLTALRQN
jgi:predicted permease